MIIFTEHNEVIMSVADMRALLQQASRISALYARANETIPISLFENRVVREIEQECRNDKDYPSKIGD